MVGAVRRVGNGRSDAGEGETARACAMGGDGVSGPFVGHEREEGSLGVGPGALTLTVDQGSQGLLSFLVEIKVLLVFVLGLGLSLC